MIQGGLPYVHLCFDIGPWSYKDVENKTLCHLEVLFQAQVLFKQQLLPAVLDQARSTLPCHISTQHKENHFIYEGMANAE